jgi:hypothetical protein
MGVQPPDTEEAGDIDGYEAVINKKKRKNRQISEEKLSSRSKLELYGLTGYRCRIIVRNHSSCIRFAFT